MKQKRAYQNQKVSSQNCSPTNVFTSIEELPSLGKRFKKKKENMRRHESMSSTMAEVEEEKRRQRQQNPNFRRLNHVSPVVGSNQVRRNIKFALNRSTAKQTSNSKKRAGEVKQEQRRAVFATKKLRIRSRKSNGKMMFFSSDARVGNSASLKKPKQRQSKGKLFRITSEL